MRRRQRRAASGSRRRYERLPEAVRGGDVLARPPRRSIALIAVAGLAVLAHLVVVGALSGFASWLSEASATPKREVIEVVVVEPDPVVESAPEPQPEPDAEPDPEPEPEPVRDPEPPPERRSRVTRPEPDPEPTARAPRKIVGIDYGSTVDGGDGPAMATGNSLDGSTASKAVDPRDVAPLGPSPVPASRNRVSTRVAGAGTTLVKPERTRKVVPIYPPELRAQGIEARVVVEVVIDASGAVKSVSLISKASHQAFNEAARVAAQSERFSPATRNGTPIEFRLSFSYRFRIND